ncbi:MAG: DUF1015 domain-containing protein [Eubacteriales bacterium]|nr:DUF1015 domain-containing protein [Eubacteriales bacterium]
MSVFRKAEILIPKNVDLEKWSVVACDQFTSEPEYWHEAESIIGDAPSTLNLVYPEAYLSEGDARIESINKTMDEYIEKDMFEYYSDSVFYIERTLPDGKVRKGIIGAIDLEEYDFTKSSKSAIRATEGTVIERIPPRVKIRENASMELPHVLLLINDESMNIIEKVTKSQKLYDFELMLNGGHLTGWLVSDEDANLLIEKFDKFEDNAPDGLLFAVGDGNHSLATAKTCWENIKGNLTDAERENHPARFCLVEIENIHDDALIFEPIHRIVFNVDPQLVIKQLNEEYECSTSDNGGHKVEYVFGYEKGTLYVKDPSNGLAVGALQTFLDRHNYETDYIHGDDVVEKLAIKDNSIGFILPVPDKSDLFKSVISDGALPRKTFSMGEANEKRYYMEAKMIK